ncbi:MULTISPECIES: DUF4231 domain-containing protein [Enterobacteriaceae]|uniref:DUF4231 domain-containing protein n=1 Tax=Enterobacteriaceae TaxID=543 RepID=UPI001480E267|nr:MULTISPECIES: DUF4231 domain-containing protein [Enterobacteriaceae]HDS2366980.1 DUF4231 domain-containing protein [Klebsiella pneumoniae subsp. pneumoniae]MCZ0815947.1 DUF4231 domain-containing protein [Klebsiella pneumoniae]MDT3538222.1 DUF4231 domain-containing protein [Cronobacter malonaticus]HBQ1992520.1 DUF4231 domain-containing protein [Klebsiella pneumoniae]HBQ2008661.1 DUF4231 domain-containing protein [Klebsiella pneumoniae]
MYKLTKIVEMTNLKITKMKSKVRNTKRKAITFRVLSLSLATITTIFVGVGSEHLYFPFLPLITSAFLTLMVGLESYFSFQEQWNRQKFTLLKLYQLQNKLTLSDPNDSFEKEVLDSYVKEYLSIWDNDLSTWEKIQNQRNNNSKNENKP